MKLSIKSTTTNQACDKRATLSSNHIPNIYRLAGFLLLILLAPLSLGVFAIYHEMSIEQDAIASAIKELAVYPSLIKPEPHERWSYLFVVLAIPLFAILSILLTRPSCINQSITKYILRPSRHRATIIQNGLLAMSFFIIVLITAYSDHTFYLKHTLFTSWWFVAAIFLAIAFNPIDYKPLDNSDRVGWLAIFLFCLVKMSHSIFGSMDYHALYIDGHFEVPFYSIVRAMDPGTLYSDCPSQYGLYATFLIPIFSTIGVSTINYTIVMSILSALCSLLFYWFLKRTCRHPSIALLVWLAYFSLPYLMMFNNRELFHAAGLPYRLDPYFQFSPIRLLFPAILFTFAILQRNHYGRFFQFFSSAALGLGVYWNLETGIIVMVTWLLYQLYLDNSLRVMPVSAITVLGGYLLGFGLYIAGHFMTYGHALDLNSLFVFQDIYYVSGFFMLPMPLIGSWLPLALLLAWGILYSIWGWHLRLDDPQRQYIFLVSIFGAGFFAYYQGRSHPWVLPAVVLPGLMIAGYILDTWLITTRNTYERRIGMIGLNAVIATLILSIINNIYIARDDLFNRVYAINTRAAKDIRSIRSMVAPGKEALFLSNNLAVLHTETNTRPVLCKSFPEMVLKRDVAHISMLLHNTHDYPIIIDVEWLERIRRNPEWSNVIHALDAYVVELVSPNSRFLRVRMRGHN
jgi:hypothetical protein